MDSKSAFAKVSGQGLKVSLKVAKKIERFATSLYHSRNLLSPVHKYIFIIAVYNHTKPEKH